MKQITPQWMIEQGFSKTFAKRFWAKVNKNGPIPPHMPHLGPCWEWMASRSINGRGYGVITRGRNGDGLIHSQRAVWMLVNGQIPKEKPQVLHKCDNKLCVRPSHLFVGTVQDNLKDRDAKKRCKVPKPNAKGEKNHKAKFTAVQIAHIRSMKGKASHRELAKFFGVVHSCIGNILRGNTY